MLVFVIPAGFQREASLRLFEYQLDSMSKMPPRRYFLGNDEKFGTESLSLGVTLLPPSGCAYH